MSVNYNRAKYKKALSRRHYRALFLNELYPPYYEEGLYNRVWQHGMYEDNWNKPMVFGYQYRMWRSWKHNRKTQWKQKKKYY